MNGQNTKEPVDLLIDYIKKYSLSTPHSENFSKQVCEIFDIKMQEKGLKKLKLTEIEEDIHFRKLNNGTYDLGLVTKYNELALTY